MKRGRIETRDTGRVNVLLLNNSKGTYKLVNTDWSWFRTQDILANNAIPNLSSLSFMDIGEAMEWVIDLISIFVKGGRLACRGYW